MLEAAVAAARLAGELDAILSVDVIRMYKPRPEVYRLVTDAFAVGPGEVVFVSSNRWDVMGAAAFGFRAVWVPDRVRVDRVQTSCGYGVPLMDYAGERPHHRRKQDEAEFPGADEGAQPVRYFELGQRLGQPAPRFRALNDRTSTLSLPGLTGQSSYSRPMITGSPGQAGR